MSSLNASKNDLPLHEIEIATQAAQSLAIGVAELVGWLFNVGGAAKLLGLDETEMNGAMHGWNEPPDPWAGGTKAPSVLMAERTRDMARYAWHGCWSGSPQDVQDALSEYALVFELMQISPVAPNGSELFADDAKQTLERVWKAAWGRFQLDQREAISISEIAALAKVSEKTVRMAANPKNKMPLRTTNDGTRTHISAGDALNWLTPRGYKPTRFHDNGPGQTPISDASSLATSCVQWSRHAHMEPEELAKLLDWAPDQVTAYQAIWDGRPEHAIAAFSPKALRSLAELLGMPEPDTFGRQAYLVLATANANAVITQQLGGVG